MVLVHLLYFCAAHDNIHIMITHMAGINNNIADAISRFQMERFRSLAPAANPNLCQLQDQCQSLGVAPSTRCGTFY